MPEHDIYRKSASNRCSTLQGSAVANSSHRNSSANFRGSKRVSHRRSQNTNTDQKVQVSNDAKVATNGHWSNVIQKDARLASNQAFEGSGQTNRKANFDSAKQMKEFTGLFKNLEITNRNDQSRKSWPNKNFLIQTPFRDLDLYPTKDDIQSQGLPDLEPNIVSGPYKNVEHYLDVQFRLLREDFVGSVRNGVQHFQRVLSNPPNKSQFKYDGIRIYPRIQFERVQTTKSNKLGVLVNFDPDGKSRNVKWKESKRFMFGSLLLFTVDNFTTFFLCTVVERDVDALKAGKILVSLTDNLRNNPLVFKRHYLMAECEAFFDPYFLVMKLLREFDENTFPMTKYIVKCSTNPQYPSYVSDFGVLKVNNRIIAPPSIAEDKWPTAEELQLDSFQLRAFKAALTRDFCVIQGPPGTGKTFIGLKIVQSIWHNANSFNHKLRLPILVVCMANHAVDQFLEGVVKFTHKVVRVGGQSRSEVMKKYNLREQARAQNRYSSDKLLRGKIWGCQQDIDRIGQLMKCAQQPSGILSARVLSDIVRASHKHLVKDDDSLIQWLLPKERLIREYQEWDFQKFKSQYEVKKVAPAKKPEVDQAEEDDDDFGDEEELTCDPQQRTSYEVNDEKCYAISLQEICRKCVASINRYDQLKKDQIQEALKFPSILFNRMNSLKIEINQYITQFANLKERLDNPIHNEDQCADKQLFDRNPHGLDVDQRWMIYWQWTLQLVGVLSKKLEDLEVSHSENVQLLNACRQQQDLEVMQRADVVGMTTSGAARLNSLLKLLQPAVVVIEEAGEVLESHVIASLTNKCQHVILIGDHEQLRPITAVYELSQRYKMNVSLFERLVKNGMDCPVLNVQHRMRPEISCLISPLIYKDLKNHPSVLNFESVRGVEKDVFFVDHNEYESSIGDSSSKQNEFEARFVIHLAIYLVQQQYDPTKITILTTYAAQRTLLLNLQRLYSLDKQVKCVVVDKYQGEENDIVLLSLVRSNANGNIGFLDTKNRVCVALSRAKKGFYMIGNMNCLAEKSSLWRSIRKTLTDNEAIGSKLPLYCSIHKKRTLVASVSDFTPVKDGGCGEVCNQKCRCGHVCQSKCHYTSGNHPDLKCCQRVLKTLWPCGHEEVLECFKDPTSVNCKTCPSSSVARNRSQNSTRGSYGCSPTLPKHSYSFAPIISSKRRSIFSRCCLL